MTTELKEIILESYFELSENELFKIRDELYNEYNSLKKSNLNLDMSRGKPCKKQLDLSNKMLDCVSSDSEFFLENFKIDVRNYGGFEGLPELRHLFSKIMDVPFESVFIGGNSSLSLMYDCISCFFESTKTRDIGKTKFLCPCPGYDRHFAICEYFDIEMIPIEMTKTGPDMDSIESIVSNDETVCGIWCVPKYSNPTGVTYSDELVSRLAALKTKCENFKIFWDMAYAVHDLDDNNPDKLLSLYDESKKFGTQERLIYFCSTSKITFAGSGVSALAAFGKTLAEIKKMYSKKIISFDKINQLRHAIFLKDFDNLKEHMKKHRQILKPKFDLVTTTLEKSFNKNSIATWSNPHGGYFVNVETFGSAKRVVDLCEKIGLKITPAGATFPYGNDKNDSNIRIAPSFPEIKELEHAMKIFTLCVKITAIEKLIATERT